MNFPKLFVFAILPLLFTPLLSAAEDSLHEIEIKLFVPPDLADAAFKSLKLDREESVAQDVCFFDTADGTLAAHKLIFRARQAIGKAGDSIVKIRTTSASTQWSDEEQTLPVEQDWINGNQPVISRSLKQKLSQKGILAKVVAGNSAPSDLLNDEQKNLITRRIPGFNFDSLKCFGPIKTEVWKNHCKFDGFPEPVTVEFWHLESSDRIEQLLEVSTKASVASVDQARTQANQFFAAAKTAGMGAPTPQTKTNTVLDFYNSNR